MCTFLLCGHYLLLNILGRIGMRGVKHVQDEPKNPLEFQFLGALKEKDHDIGFAIFRNESLKIRRWMLLLGGAGLNQVVRLEYCFKSSLGFVY